MVVVLLGHFSGWLEVLSPPLGVVNQVENTDRKWFSDACGEGANSNLLVIVCCGLRGLTVNERLLDGNSLFVKLTYI